MQSDEDGQVYGPAQDSRQAAPQEVAGDQTDPACADALAHQATWGVAQECAHGALSVLWGASQHGYAAGVSGMYTPLLVSDTPTAQSAPSYYLAADIRPRNPMAAATPYPASLSRATLARHDPRQEPGAVVPHAGLCAGGAGELTSLSRPLLPDTSERRRA